MVNYTLYLANLSLENSFVKPDRRYRLMGIEPFPYLERGHQKSDLQWLQTNAYYQSRRKALGADVAIFFTGGTNANAITYSNQHLYSAFADRGIIVWAVEPIVPKTNTCGALAQPTLMNWVIFSVGGTRVLSLPVTLQRPIAAITIKKRICAVTPPTASLFPNMALKCIP